MTENEGATASSRFPSFFYNYSFSPYSASYAENRDGNLRMKGGERGFIQVFFITKFQAVKDSVVGVSKSQRSENNS